MKGTLKTVIYILLSIIIALVGVVLLSHANPQDQIKISIATSIVAAGITSLIFGIIRYIDERDMETSSQIMRTKIEGLTNDISGLERSLGDVRNFVSAVRDPNERRVFDRHPDDEFRNELNQIHVRTPIVVDTLGLSLIQFCDDHLNNFIVRGNSRLRLLIQNPLKDNFTLICQQEGREVLTMMKEILLVTRQILSLSAHGQAAGMQASPHGLLSGGTRNAKPTKVELKWFDDFPSITFTRLNNVMYVRARYLKEANQPPMFYEVYYDGVESKCFHSYSSYFDLAWNSSTTPTQEMYDQLENKLGSN
jgi:hypothetical protein